MARLEMILDGTPRFVGAVSVPETARDIQAERKRRELCRYSCPESASMDMHVFVRYFCSSRGGDGLSRYNSTPLLLGPLCPRQRCDESVSWVLEECRTVLRHLERAVDLCLLHRCLLT